MNVSAVYFIKFILPSSSPNKSNYVTNHRHDEYLNDSYSPSRSVALIINGSSLSAMINCTFI